MKAGELFEVAPRPCCIGASLPVHLQAQDGSGISKRLTATPKGPESVTYGLPLGGVDLVLWLGCTLLGADATPPMVSPAGLLMRTLLQRSGAAAVVGLQCAERIKAWPERTAAARAEKQHDTWQDGAGIAVVWRFSVTHCGMVDKRLIKHLRLCCCNVPELHSLSILGRGPSYRTERRSPKRWTIASISN